MNLHGKKFAPLMLLFFLVLPASTNFKLKDYSFGSGGVGNATSPNYAMEAISGQLAGDQGSSPTYKIGAGLIFMGQANVPVAPAFTNPSSYYNKLKLVLDASGNPSDTKFAIAISTDNFVTTNYVQSDNTVGAALGSEDYQTYAAWGGASGVNVIGLTVNTTYKVKVKAMQGKFSETGYGPIATAATVNPTLTFNISQNTINFGSLTAGSVVDSPQSIVSDFVTNGESGGSIYIIGKNAGLQSSAAGYIINSATGNLTALTEGFGAQGTGATQMSIVSPYDGVANSVGIVDTNIREIFTAASPIAAGQGTFLLKAKSSTVTPAAVDYTETVTVLASGRF